MRRFAPLFIVLLLTSARYPAAAQQVAPGGPATLPPAATAAELPVNLSALAALDCDPAQVVRSLARSLQLQPYQALVLRRALLASPDPAADAAALPAAETLRLVLSTAQLTQLQQVLATPPAVLTHWLALNQEPYASGPGPDYLLLPLVDGILRAVSAPGRYWLGAAHGLEVAARRPAAGDAGWSFGRVTKAPPGSAGRRFWLGGLSRLLASSGVIGGKEQRKANHFSAVVVVPADRWLLSPVGQSTDAVTQF